MTGRAFGILLIFIWPVSGIATAQVTGKIYDDSGNPLEYATAAFYNPEDSTLVNGTITGNDGLFNMEGLKRGTYYLVASFIGYRSQTVDNIVVEDHNTVKDLGIITLTLGNELEEVVVQGNRANMVNKIDRQVFEAGIFQNAQGGTGTDVLRNLPAVTIDAQGQISVRGSTGFVVLLNGSPLQGDPGAFIGQLPANAIDKVEIITTPSARYDPEGKAGIINIITKKGTVNGVFAQINVRGGLPSIERYGNDDPHQRYGADGTYNIRKDRWNISLGASYQRNDLGGRREGDVYTIINDTLTRFPSSGERSFDEVNYSGRFTIDYSPNPADSWSLGFYAGKRSKDRLANIVYYDNHQEVPAENGSRIWTLQYYNHNLRIRRGDFVLGSFDYRHGFDNGSGLSASFLYEYTLLGGPTVSQNISWPEKNIIYQDEYNTNDNPLHGIRAQLDYTWKPFSFGKLETGYQYRDLVHTGDFYYERKNNTTGMYELVPEFSSEVDLRRTIHSGYANLTGKKDRWEYAAGIRLEAMNRDLDLRDKSNTIDTAYIYDFIKLYPSASVRYTFGNDVALKAAYSKRVERTTTFKMNPFPEREHSETLEQGDPTLLPEFIDLLELGITKDFNGSSSIYATAYYRNVENLINRANTIYNDTILNRIYSNVGIGRSLGMETGIDLKITDRWSGFIGANVYHYSIDGTFNDRKVDTDATVYSINANTTVKFWQTASLQFTLNYLSDRNTAQGEDSRFYSPNLTLRKTFMNDRLAVALQWLNMDLGLLHTNEQRITTWQPGAFYTTTNYIYEVDMVLLNVSYTISNAKNRSRFIKSEFGEREF